MSGRKSTSAEIQKVQKELFLDEDEEQGTRRNLPKNDDGVYPSNSVTCDLSDLPAGAKNEQKSAVRNEEKPAKYDPRKNLKNPVFDIRQFREKDMLRALGNVGVISLENAHNHFYHEHVKRLEKDRFIQRHTRMGNGKLISYYSLGNRGKNYVKRYFLHSGLYRTNKLQLAHDLALSEQYLSLKRSERMTWMNDDAVGKYLKEKGAGGCEVIDGAYTDSDGNLVGVEIITQNYSEEMAAAKIRTITEHFQVMRLRRA